MTKDVLYEIARTWASEGDDKDNENYVGRRCRMGDAKFGGVFVGVEPATQPPATSS
jgi:hypothetical protein